MVDIENQAEAEGSAIKVADSYRLNRPKVSKAPLKPVPQHLRKRRDRRPLPQRMQKPTIPKTDVVDWLGEFLDRK